MDYKWIIGGIRFSYASSGRISEFLFLLQSFSSVSTCLTRVCPLLAANCELQQVELDLEIPVWRKPTQFWSFMVILLPTGHARCNFQNPPSWATIWLKFELCEWLGLLIQVTKWRCSKLIFRPHHFLLDLQMHCTLSQSSRMQAAPTAQHASLVVGIGVG